jgi:hypothetical protein
LISICAERPATRVLNVTLASAAVTEGTSAALTWRRIISDAIAR